MEGTGETHYISFLGGDGGGMGNRRPSSASSSSTPRGGNRRFGSQPFSLRHYLFRKRFGGMQAKAQLLLAAACVCLLCFAGFFLMVPKDNGSIDSDIIPVPPNKPVVDVDTDGYPPKIYDWEEYHFAHAFNAFMSEHGKKYSNTVERERRYKIFKSNLTHIYLHNEQGYSYTLGMNQFGDLNREEFSRFVAGVKRNPRSSHEAKLGVDTSLLSATDLPASVDWRSRGCVTPPKDQGQCGSCWAFSSTGAVEGAWCAHTGRLTSLSEQMLMDCSGYLGNNSCDGGLMDDAFAYIAQHGLCSEEDYPYEGRDNKCRSKQCSSRVKVTGFYDVPAGNEAAMRAALAKHGPVSIAIQADQIDFQFYKDGVFDAPCGSALDHGVLLVGYGTDPKTKKDFFIMKNSWGNKWGDRGYMYMAQHRGIEGECGLLLSGSFPLTPKESPPKNDAA